MGSRLKKKKPEHWQRTTVEVFRYGFFVLYIAGLLLIVSGARRLSHVQENTPGHLSEARHGV